MENEDYKSHPNVIDVPVQELRPVQLPEKMVQQMPSNNLVVSIDI